MIVLEREAYGGSTQTLHRFENGYGASVLRGGFAYGGLELAVVKYLSDRRAALCYDTPITDYVLGYLKEEEIPEILKRIENL